MSIVNVTDVTNIADMIPEHIFNDTKIKVYSVLDAENKIVAQYKRDEETGAWSDVTSNPVHLYKQPTVAEIKKQEEQERIDKELAKAEALLVKITKRLSDEE